ncbi:hypothetical protein [Georgenia sunbinii]|uniref:hypothetical protein n=1 Tax=Georgenia sunbinii TaxID=3117728 RepID=UPI002F260043
MKTPTRRSITAIVLSALAVGSLTACGDDATAEFEPAASSSPSSSPVTAPSAPEPAGPEEKPTEDAGDDDSEQPAAQGPVGPADAIDTITYALPGADERAEATATVGLHSLRVDGETMLLELSFTPEFNGDDTYGIYEMNGGSKLMPVLNDRQNLKQYTVLSVNGSTEWATGTVNADPKVSSGQTLHYWGYFAAPEDDIDTISVGVGTVEFDDVTIER